MDMSSVTEAFRPRPVDGYREQGAQAWMDGQPISACPHPETTLASAEWRLGHVAEARMASLGGPFSDEIMALDDEEHAARMDRAAAVNSAARAMPSAAVAADAIGLPTDRWPMNCHAVATAVVEAGLMAPLEAEHGPARVCYGVFDGAISARSPFAGRRVARHGWIEFPSGLVVDPTRWVFDGVGPALWAGSSEDYDLGAARLRRAVGGRPPPPFDLRGKVHRITGNDPAIAAAVGALLRDAPRIARDRTLGAAQAFWLANLPPEAMGAEAPDIHHELERMGLGALIPVDSRAQTAAFVP